MSVFLLEGSLRVAWSIMRGDMTVQGGQKYRRFVLWKKYCKKFLFLDLIFQKTFTTFASAFPYDYKNQFREVLFLIKGVIEIIFLD